MTDQIPLPFRYDKPEEKVEGRRRRGKPGSKRRVSKSSGGGRGGDAQPPGRHPGAPRPGPIPVEPVALHEAARIRYLNYAISVITARALPDVRDGLKPVQRRILHAMYHNLKLTPDSRYRKSAAVVGEVMAKYHPHGDQSIYDAMVRMAQDFSLRSPLVDGNGNFGSLDGDPPAAMRYTEARLRPLAVRLLEEIKQHTVAQRPNYDGTQQEPIVVPAQFPNLLVNGSTGIAVGLATNIPPHNLAEVVDAAVALIDEPDLTTPELCAHVKGPDFPMGGLLCTPPEDLIRLYDRGEGPVRVRGEYTRDPERKNQLVITSIPFGVNKAQLVEAIAEHIIRQRVPQLVDVRDESTEDIRVVLELKRGARAEEAMAFLFKHTPLESTFHVNLTALVPTENPEVGAPRRLTLKSALQHFLDFRLEVVTKRLQYQLEAVKKRIHVLEGFERIFDELDEAIKLIRASNGKADAARRLMARFLLDEVQAEAILETKLYRLARMEIQRIRKELEALRQEEARLFTLLCDRGLRWELVREELQRVKAEFGEPRRTKADGKIQELVFDPDAYVVREDTHVIVTRDGWMKRQKSFSDVSAIRTREGDAVGWVYSATTQDTVAFFTNLGFAYVLRIDEIPATTGYGEPVQRQFKFADQERVVGVVCFNERCLPERPDAHHAAGSKARKSPARPTGEPAAPGSASPAHSGNGNGEAADDTGNDNGHRGPLAVAITRMGKGLRFPLELHRERSTKTGRRFIRLSGKDDGVVAVYPCTHDASVSLATVGGRALLFPVSDLNVLKGSGKGVTAIKLDNDTVMAFRLVQGKNDGLKVVTNRGRQVVINARTYHSSRRGGKGTEVIRRGKISLLEMDPIVIRRDEEDDA